jgi:hypothetical protein
VFTWQDIAHVHHIVRLLLLQRHAGSETRMHDLSGRQGTRATRISRQSEGERLARGPVC